MTHDYDEQRRETLASFKAMKGVQLPAQAAVDFVFFVEELDADWAAFEAALRNAGYTPRRDEDGETLYARSGPLPLTPESIWDHERAATAIALAHEFYPDGWDIVE